MLRTPFWRYEREAGAVFTDFAGWKLPLQFSSARDEVLAVRQRAGFFDISHMTRFFVEGKDAKKLVLSVFSRGELRDGVAKYGFLISPDGKVVDDSIVYKISDEVFFVVANALTRSRVLALFHDLANSKRFSVKIREVTFDTVFFAVQGPESPRFAGQIITTVDLDMKRFHFRYIRYRKGDDMDEILVSRTGYTGEDGFEVVVSGRWADVVWGRVRESGITLCGLASRDILRLEAGMILFGKDITENDTPFGSHYERFVDNRKCIGYALLKRRFEENPSWLSVVIFSGKRMPREGTEIFNFSGEEKIGRITSSVFSWTLERPIAFARFSKKPVPNQKVYALLRNAKVEGEVADPGGLKKLLQMRK